MRKLLLLALVTMTGTVPVLPAAAQVVNEATSYCVDLTFAPGAPETLEYSVYDRQTRWLLTPWTELPSAATNCPTGLSQCTPGDPLCISVLIPWDENLFVGRCANKASCVSDSDCPTGQCKTRLEDTQDHTMSVSWTWGSDEFKASDRFHIKVRNLEFVPKFTATPTNTPTQTPTNTPTATPTRTPTNTP